MDEKDLISRLLEHAQTDDRVSPYNANEALLTEAADTLREAWHLLQDVVDGVQEVDGRADDGVVDMEIVRAIRTFLASPLF